MSEKKKKVSEDPSLDEILESSRRDFLKKLGLVGAASVSPRKGEIDWRNGEGTYR
jgi:hypothetical protein